MDPASKIDSVTRCPRCDIRLGVAAEWFGQSVSCTKCESVFTLQSLSSERRADRRGKLVNGTQPSESSGADSNRLPETVDLPEKIGRYVPQRCLGRGGFGVVYLARDPILNREVAIKLPYAEMQSRNGSETKQTVAKQVHARLSKEAQAAARLRHPNIVSVFDHGTCEIGAFIVHEYIPGPTLERTFNEGDFSQREAIELVASLADALSYAAAEGIVHRDIKPANIIIDAQGRPQLTDFGLAEAIREGKALTGGKVAGTPAYMSPEQARGEDEITPAADQYSLGGVLFEAVTGERPVHTSGVAALAEVASGVGPSTETLRRVPSDLRSVIAKSMHADPQLRYADCKELATDLRSYLDGFPVKANPKGPISHVLKWSRRNRTTAATLLFALALLVGVAVASSIAAVVFQRQGRTLSTALKRAEAARIKADEKTELASEAEASAQREAKAATQSRLIAEAETKKATDALNRLKREMGKRRLAEAARDREKEQREIATEEANVAVGKLDAAIEEKRSLQYAEFLSMAASQISQGRTEPAIRALAECDPADRGWEWRWLSQNAANRREFLPLEKIPRELANRFAWSSPIAQKFGLQIYNGWRTRIYDDPSREQFARLKTNPSRTRGAYVRSTPIVLKQPGKPQKEETLRFLQKVDFSSGSFEDICGQVSDPSGLHFFTDDLVSTIISTKIPGAAPNQPPDIKRFAQVWSLGALPTQFLAVEIEETDWIPSFVKLVDRPVILGAMSPNRLMSWNLIAGEEPEVAQQLDMRFVIAHGPDAMKQIPDGRIALRDEIGKLHFVDPVTLESSSGPDWETVMTSRSRVLWDSQCNYLALFTPGTMEARIEDPKNLPVLERSWVLMDVLTGRTIAELPMPMSRPRQVKKSIKKGTRDVLVDFISREMLDFRQLEIAEGGQVVSVLDALGGIWTWRRGNEFGTEEIDPGWISEVTIANVRSDLKVATDQTKVCWSASSEDPFGMRLSKPRVRKLRRDRGNKIIDIAVHPGSQRVGILDSEGYFTIYQQGQKLSEERAIGAVTLLFSQRGEFVVLGTNTGELVTAGCEDGVFKRQRPAHNGSVTSLAAVPAESAIVSTGDDSSIRMWDQVTGIRIDIPEFYLPQRAHTLEYDSRTGRLLACANRSVTVMSCSRTGLARDFTTPVPHDVRHACFFDNRQRILVAGQRSSSILDATSGRILFALPRQRYDIVEVYADRGDPCFVLGNSTIKCLRAGSDVID